MPSLRSPSLCSKVSPHAVFLYAAGPAAHRPIGDIGARSGRQWFDIECYLPCTAQLLDGP